MGNIGDPISTALPTVGSSGPAYATNYNAIMSEVMARLTARIPFSALLSNSTLDMNGQAILNAAYMTFQNTGSSPGASPANRLVVFNGDIWFVSPSGAVQITSGAALASSSIGGIEGDYGGVNPARLRYNAAGQRFEAYHNYSTTTWASYRGFGVDIAAGATSTNMAQLRYGGAATVTFTLPPTIPSAGNTALLTINDSGDIASNGTVTEDLTFSGSADIKHGDKVRPLPLDGYGLTATLYASGVWSNINGGWAPGAPLMHQLTGVSNAAVIPLRGFRAGDRLKSLILRVIHTGATHTYEIYKRSDGSIINSTTVSGLGFDTINIDSPVAFTGDEEWFLHITATADTSTYRGLRGTYDRP